MLSQLDRNKSRGYYAHFILYNVYMRSELRRLRFIADFSCWLCVWSDEYIQQNYTRKLVHKLVQTKLHVFSAKYFFDKQKPWIEWNTTNVLIITRQIGIVDTQIFQQIIDGSGSSTVD